MNREPSGIKNKILYKLFGKFIEPVCSFFYNDLRISPIILFVILFLILIVYDIVQLKRKKTTVKFAIYKICIEILAIALAIFSIIKDQQKINGGYYY